MGKEDIPIPVRVVFVIFWGKKTDDIIFISSAALT